MYLNADYWVLVERDEIYCHVLITYRITMEILQSEYDQVSNSPGFIGPWTRSAAKLAENENISSDASVATSIR